MLVVFPSFDTLPKFDAVSALSSCGYGGFPSGAWVFGGDLFFLIPLLFRLSDFLLKPAEALRFLPAYVDFLKLTLPLLPLATTSADSIMPPFELGKA
jgi:hypothetical protein